jgi:nucleoside-diphosphate-sugar epimerase
VDEILHCASCTSFSEKNRAEIEAANIGGLPPILEIASKGRCFFLHHISTAYVAGEKTGVCPEAFVDSRDFTNIYEETKYLGERIMAAACQREGIRLNIYRPSVVYGDSRTGRSLRFNALYYPVKTALFFKDIYARDIRENGGKRAAALGARTESDGALYLPLRIEAAGQGGINLIPIDFFAKAFLALMEEGLEGEIFHIVNGKTTAVEEIIAYAQRLFQMRGIRTAPREEFDRLPPNSLEILFNSYMEIYRPYLRDGRIFDKQKMEALLKVRGLSCPELDYEIFSRCMQYAVDVDWGARLFRKSSRSMRQGPG